MVYVHYEKLLVEGFFFAMIEKIFSLQFIYFTENAIFWLAKQCNPAIYSICSYLRFFSVNLGEIRTIYTAQ